MISAKTYEENTYTLIIISNKFQQDMLQWKNSIKNVLCTNHHNCLSKRQSEKKKRDRFSKYKKLKGNHDYFTIEKIYHCLFTTIFKIYSLD